MSASEHLGPQFDTLYHSTSPRHRESIQKSGLLLGHDMNQVFPAVYMSDKPPPSSYHPGDVWKVNTHGLRISPDDDTGEDESVVGRSWAHDQGDITPDRLSLHRAGSIQAWEKGPA